MKNFLLLIAFLVSIECSYAQNTWTQKTDFQGTPRNSAVGFSIGSKGYIGTGDDGGFLTEMWEYDTSTNLWTRKSDIGINGIYRRHQAVGFSIGTKGYIGTGYGAGGVRKDFWEYDPATDTWTQKADFGGTARYQATGFSIGNKGYVGTGFDVAYRKDFWEYDPSSNTWSQKLDFGGAARSSATGFSIGTKGYLGTGYDGSGKKDFWEYNPSSNTWAQKLDFGGTARYGVTSFSIGSKGYIGTGYDVGVKKDFWEYDPSSNTWAQKLDFGGTARYFAAGFAIGTKGYLGTGFDGVYPDPNTIDFWEYSPSTIDLFVNDNSTLGDQYTTAVGNDANTGTTAAPFATIGKAVSVASPGQIIFVDAGTYLQSIDVTKSVTLYGTNYNVSPNGGARVAETIIDVNGITIPTAFIAQTPGTTVQIKGFTMQNGSPLTDGHEHRSPTQDIVITFEKNIVSHGDNLFCGTLTRWKTVTITDNLFQNIDLTATSSAIQLHDFEEIVYGAHTATVAATVTDNVISGTNFGGILLDNLASASVLRNTISNTPGEAGIQLAGGMGTATVSQNVISGANTSLTSGVDAGAIRIHGSTFTGTVNITNNTVTVSKSGFAVKTGENITGKGIHLNDNSFDNTNSLSIYQGGTGNLDATCNWNGTADCAAITARFLGNVTYSPFRVSGTDNNLVTIGFQPAAGTCSGNCAPPGIANPITATSSLKLYPVPTVSSKISISYISVNETTVSISVVDILGRVLRKEDRKVTKGLNTMSLNIQEIKKGNFSIVIDNGISQVRQMFIKY